MDQELGNKILTLLDRHRIMTIATPRPDGGLQATIGPCWLLSLKERAEGLLAAKLSIPRREATP